MSPEHTTVKRNTDLPSWRFTILAVGEPNEAQVYSEGRDWGAGQEPRRLLFSLPTVDSLGISDELKDKLEDVLIPEQQFTLGRMLGKGVWGCVGVS